MRTFMNDNFVFVSHAGQDKPLLRPLVQALIDAGLKVWLDTPTRLGYSAEEVERHFYRLHAGGRWGDEIDEAQGKAACILICWSKRAEGDDALKRHPVLFEEASFGRKTKKLVCCQIDEMDPTQIPNGFSAQQMPDIRAEENRALIINDIQRMMEQTAWDRADRRRAADRHRSPIVPYLADREAQESAIKTGFEEIGGSGGVRPFLIVGPENECVDEFLKRLEEHTSRKCLNGHTNWEVVEVEWPGEEERGRFAASFGRRLGGGLGRHSAGLSPRELAAVLAGRGRPVAVISRLLAETWKADEAGRVRAWLEYWRDIANQPGTRRIFPLFSLKMPAARPGWKHVPGGWLDVAGWRNRAIWKALGALATEFSDLKVVRAQTLAPLPRTDVDTWLNEHFKLEDRDYRQAKAGVERLFAGRRHKRFGVPHEEFAQAMEPLFRGAA